MCKRDIETKYTSIDQFPFLRLSCQKEPILLNIRILHCILSSADELTKEDTSTIEDIDLNTIRFMYLAYY